MTLYFYQYFMSYSIYGFTVPYSVLWPATIVLASLVWLCVTKRWLWLSASAQAKVAKPALIFEDVRVTKILIHPIKSCRGTSVQSAKYTPEGLENDRSWAIIEAGSHNIVTARKTPKMVLIHPRIVLEESSPYGGRLEVSFPEGSGCETFAIPLIPTEEILRTWETTDRLSHFEEKDIDGYICQSVASLSCSKSQLQSPSAILSTYFGRPVHLVYKGPSPRPCETTPTFPTLDATVRYQDGYPLLIVSEESLEAVEKSTRQYVGVQGVGEKWKDSKLEMERFRPNIVIKGADMPFAEDLWEEIAIGPERNSADASIPGISLVKKCARCLLPNVDNKSGVRDPAVPFKVLMKVRNELDEHQKMQAMFGCNGVSKGDGVVKVGDWLTVRKLAVG